MKKRLLDVDEQLDDLRVEEVVTDEEWTILEKEKVSDELLEETLKSKWFSKLLNKHDAFISKWRSEGKTVERERKNLAEIIEEEEKAKKLS